MRDWVVVGSALACSLPLGSRSGVDKPFSASPVVAGNSPMLDRVSAPGAFGGLQASRTVSELQRQLRLLQSQT